MVDNESEADPADLDEDLDDDLDVDLDFPPDPDLDWLGEDEDRSKGPPQPFQWEGDWLGLKHLKAGKVTRISHPERPDYDGLSAHAIGRRRAYGTEPERPPLRVEIRCETFAPTMEHYTLPTMHCCAWRSPVKASSDTIKVQDRSLDAAPTFLIVRKQRFECRNCKKRFYEVLPDINEARGVKQRGKKLINGKPVPYKKLDVLGIKHLITKRLRRSIAFAAVEYPAAKAADLLHVDVGLVDRVFADYRDKILADHKFMLPNKLAIDGSYMLGKARCVIADVDANRIIEILPHDNSIKIYKYFSERFGEFERMRVEFFIHDMAEMYNPISTLFPYATQIIDRFHVVKLIQKYTDEARNDIVSNMDDSSKRLMRRNVRLFKGPRYSLNAKDRQEHDKLVRANKRLYYVTQARQLFEAIFQEDAKEDALWRYRQWVAYIRRERKGRNKDGASVSYSLMQWFGPLHNTMENWKAPIFAGFDNRYTTAFVEGMNRRVKEINRDANGLTFDALRAKALLKYGEYHTRSDLMNFSRQLFPYAVMPEKYSLGSAEFAVLEELIKECQLNIRSKDENLYLVIHAIFWRTMNGFEWRDLKPYPRQFGDPAVASRAFHRWARVGVWKRLVQAADERRQRLELPPLQHRPKLQVENRWIYDDDTLQEAVEYILMLPGLLIMIAEQEEDLYCEEPLWVGFTPDDLQAAARG